MRRKQFCLRLALSLWSVGVCLLIGEMAIRLLGSSDIDGNFKFHSRILKPYRLPVQATKMKTERYLSRRSSAVLLYDRLLGWAPRPHGTSWNGLYQYNALGLRSPIEYSLTSQARVLRVALFGDSFTHGNDVPFENTWGYYLENGLKAGGVNAEVLNFGVPGYGLDQAYLRWKYLGHKLSPDIVVLGFQPMDIARNVNLLRLLRERFVASDIPFSKPRFILKENNLILVNSPTPPPEKVPEIVEHIESWHLAKYEYFYAPKDYQRHIWLRSRLIAFLLDAISTPRTTFYGLREDFFSLDNEPSQLTLTIIRQFKSEVEAEGGHFLIVYLADRNSLAALLRGSKLPYSKLLERIEEEFSTIRPDREMLEEAKASALDALFLGHYSAKGNQVVADVIVKFILATVVK